MKKHLVLCILCTLCCVAYAQKIKIKTGIEVLKEQNFKCLEGKRVGLITNPTGVDNHMKSTIDILHEAPNVNLVALYGPEHGVRGDVHAGDHVTDIKDASTGLPVYSLYGKTRKATPEMLKDIDVLVYDIQDIGCRSFTYISTMGLAMEAAAENNKEFIVLDRPNPVGGLKIEGNLTEDDCISLCWDAEFFCAFESASSWEDEYYVSLLFGKYCIKVVAFFQVGYGVSFRIVFCSFKLTVSS